MKKGISIFSLVLVCVLSTIGLADAATLHSGSITSDETWTPAGNPHIINGLTGVTNGATLTIEPGVEVRFNENATNPSLIIGHAGEDDPSGRLIAQGTESQKIIFTSNAASPQPGDWSHILFWASASDDSIIEHAVLEYGGSHGMIDIDSSNPTIRNCIIRYGSLGIYSYHSTSEISGCRFEENEGYGINIIQSSPVLDANEFINNGSYPIAITIGTGGRPEPVIYGTNTFSGNNPDQIYFDVYHISYNTTLRYLGIPYFFTGLTVVNNGATLTIEPGVEVRFNQDATNPRLVIGQSGGTGGKLIAQGTPSQKITFTSNAASPQPGDWAAINFNESASDDSIIEYAILEYGGSDGIIHIVSSNPTIRNCVLRNSIDDGIYVIDSASEISCCDITNNDIGIHVVGNASNNPTIINNNIFDNITYGMKNSTPGYIVNAEDNWWGHATGPGGVGPGTGDAVASGVDYDPWLTEISSCTTNPENLLYVPVTPCRIVDTRLAGGAIPPGGIRSYNVYGDVASQGGNPVGCPSPKGEPYTAHINVTAVPLGNGNIVAYPFGSPAPNASLVNYRASAQNVANSATVKTCFGCGKDINIKSRVGTAHVIIDVLGYDFKKP
jgi:parallel beta-helix repeat protein